MATTPAQDGSISNEMMTSLSGSGITTSGTSETIWDRRARLKREWRAKNADRQRAADKARYQRDADNQRSRSREYYHANKEAIKARHAERDAKPFVGVDGEGITLPNGYHAYNMLRAGNTKIEPRNGDVRLRTTDCLEYLSSLSPNNIYVAFFFDYDVAKILEDLPWERLKYLMDKEGRKRKKGGFWPVDYGEYSLDYLPRKELKVRKGNGPWITIHDVGSFFQCAFIKALELWDIGTESEREQIGEGKALRSEFADIKPEYVDKYNHLECVLLAELMSKFRQACFDVGYVPAKWQGPGLLAEAMLEKNGIPATKDYDVFSDLSEGSLYSFGQHAFYGGRFETSVVGYTSAEGQLYHGCAQYDINSAYPAALQHVPCLEHGTWERVSGRRLLESSNELSLVYGGFRPKSTRVMFYGLPIRKPDGSIHFPQSGKGWYWSFEVRAATHQDFTVYDSWVYTKRCDCTPFAFLEAVYKARKGMGKSGKGIVLKLGMNSVYGKMAQSIGSPKYSNPVWASFITAYTRTQIMKAIHDMPGCRSGWCGKDVFMIATDAFFTRNYPDDVWSMSTSDALGEWDRTLFASGLFIVQPGLYFDPNSSEAKFKTRGVPRRMVVEYKDRFLAAYADMRRNHRVGDGDVLLPMTLFIGIRQALHRNSLKLLGQFVPYKDPITGEVGRRTSFDWSTKRRPEPLPDIMDFGTGKESPHILTIPYMGTENEEANGRPIQTVPYSKDIGGLKKRELMRMLFADQPDWMQEP